VNEEEMNAVTEKPSKKYLAFGSATGGTGASIMAFLAALCPGPIAAAVLGSGGGLVGQFQPYRPYFLGGSVLMVGLGWILAYRSGCVAVHGATCAVKPRRVTVIMLWLASALTGISLLVYLLEVLV